MHVNGIYLHLKNKLYIYLIMIKQTIFKLDAKSRYISN